MSDWDDLVQQQLDHEQYHQDHTFCPNAAVQQVHPDLSCPLCFPDLYPLDPTWQNFRQWLYEIYPIRSHSGISRRYWTTIQTAQRLLTDPWFDLAFRHLLCTLRYRQLLPPVDHVLQVLLDTFQLYQDFAVNPNEFENYHLNRTARNLDSPERESEQDPTPEPTTESGTSDSDSEPDNRPPRQALPAPQPAPAAPMANAGAAVSPMGMGQQMAQGILDALNRLGNQRAHLNVKPYRGYSQDLNAWLSEYVKAANARGWDEENMLEAVPSYLQDAAYTWYENNYLNFRRWQPTNTHPRRGSAFTTAFVDAFRTPQQERQWQLELDRRMQKKEETVEQYATAFSALIKHVDPDGDLPEGTKIHMFLRGLLPAIQDLDLYSG